MKGAISLLEEPWAPPVLVGGGFLAAYLLGLEERQRRAQGPQVAAMQRGLEHLHASRSLRRCWAFYEAGWQPCFPLDDHLVVVHRVTEYERSVAVVVL